MRFPVVLPAWLAGRTRLAAPPSVRSIGTRAAALPFGITMETNHVDEIMCRLQGTSKKAALVGFDPLPVRVGVAGAGVAGTGVAGARRGSRETHRVLGVNHINNVNKEGCLRVKETPRLGEPLRGKPNTTSSSPPIRAIPVAISSVPCVRLWEKSGTSSCTTRRLNRSGFRSLLHGRRDLLGESKMLPRMRKHVYHPAFAGSYSLKYVLPALVPEMTYEGMAVADGQQAGVAWESLMRGGLDQVERDRIEKALRDYCGQDTLAMVRLLQRLCDFQQD